ncbi:hypothetical protein ACQ4PT_055719 [Festuca glaucescens]
MLGWASLSSETEKGRPTWPKTWWPTSDPRTEHAAIGNPSSGDPTSTVGGAAVEIDKETSSSPILTDGAATSKALLGTASLTRAPRSGRGGNSDIPRSGGSDGIWARGEGEMADVGVSHPCAAPRGERSSTSPQLPARKLPKQTGPGRCPCGSTAPSSGEASSGGLSTANGFTHQPEITEGLPLAIVLLAGLVKTKEFPGEWKAIFEHLKSKQLKRLDTILSLCFDDLPYDIKSCFLYLAALPEKKPVGARELIYMWMAEGFLRPEDGMTDGESGQQYIPRSVGQLRNLQTLDVWSTLVTELPKEFWMMSTLRHALGDLLVLPKKVGNLEHLQTLDSIVPDGSNEKDEWDKCTFASMIRLQTLVIWELPSNLQSKQNDEKTSAEETPAVL